MFSQEYEAMTGSGSDQDRPGLIGPVSHHTLNHIHNPLSSHNVCHHLWFIPKILEKLKFSSDDGARFKKKKAISKVITNHLMGDVNEFTNTRWTERQ